jgi:mono/diheme cytochrome c family protein
MSKHHSQGRRPAAKHRRSWLPFVIGLVGVLMVALVVLNLRTGRPSAPSSAVANPDDPQQVALGRQVYSTQCAACHGANLEGQPNWQAELPSGGRLAPPHDPSGHTWHHPDSVLFDITKRGGQASSPSNYQNNMPGFAATLSDEQIWASLAYIKSTWPANIRAMQEQVNQQAR